MSTRLSVINLFPPLDNPELTIQRRSRADPTLLNDFEMAAEGNGDPPVPDLRTMEELCQPSLNRRDRPITPIAIQATNFRVKNDMIQQVHNSCQFHGLPGDDANKHLDKFLHVTQSIKVNGVTDDALRLYLFPHSLTHHATAWFDHGWKSWGLVDEVEKQQECGDKGLQVGRGKRGTGKPTEILSNLNELAGCEQDEEIQYLRSKLNIFDDVIERVYRLNLDDLSKIRLTSHNCYSEQPKPQPIKYRGVEHLSNMLAHYN
uniref:Ubiquitin carboxyl-terminal hydrolase 12-like isoform X2 n=1 Tax=Tanacetum cinerariifolium TaxID=118510 RepID=A0A6L2KI80_TANCI|nr:ubiquitin carboxyl-terminal hydrolase 12-like isoform X2 [Tanacetum cinerariifolium]